MTRTEAWKKPRGLLDPYSDLNTPQRTKPRRPKSFGQKAREVITHTTQDRMKRLKKRRRLRKSKTDLILYVPEMNLRCSPRLSRETRRTYGKRFGKMALSQENTRHNNSPSAGGSASD